MKKLYYLPALLTLFATTSHASFDNNQWEGTFKLKGGLIVKHTPKSVILNSVTGSGEFQGVALKLCKGLTINNLTIDRDINVASSMSLVDFRNALARSGAITQETDLRLKPSVPGDFVARTYIAMYKDLQIAAANEANPELWAENHYTQFGVSEGRLYKLPDDFNGTRYVQKYADLVAASTGCKDLDTWGENHYTNYGMSEKRAYK